MREFKTHWRADRGLLERICEHGVGHPDPDHLTYIAVKYGKDAARIAGIHGCCGCCQGAYDVSTFSPGVDEEEENRDCISCGEGLSLDECPGSKHNCGHHCNHSWTHDECCWCETEFGEVWCETPGFDEDPLGRPA